MGISYSCTDSMKSFLDKPNKIILKKHTNTLNSERLNKDDENSATARKCLTQSIVYKADVTSTDNNARQTYIGVTVNNFKTR